MGLLQKLRINTRKMRPVGLTLETGRENGQPVTWKKYAVKVGIFLALVLLSMGAFPRGEVYRYVVPEGEDWRQETLTAPFDFAILKDRTEIEKERRQVRRTTPPFFEIKTDARKHILANKDTVAHQLESIFASYGDYLVNKSRGRLVEAVQDSLQYETLHRNARLKASLYQWQRLLDSYVSHTPGLSSASRNAPQGKRLDRQMLDQAWTYGQQLINLGVLDVPVDSVLTEEIIVRDNRQHQSFRRDKSHLFGLEEAHRSAGDRFKKEYPTDPELANLVGAFFRAIFQPSLRFMRAETFNEWQRKENAISPTRGIVRKGEVIVRRGEIVTTDVLRNLRSLERAQGDRSGNRLPWKVTLGQALLVLASFTFFFLYLFILRRPIFDDNRMVFLLSLLFTIIIGLFAIAMRMPGGVMFAVPLLIVSLVLTILFDSRVAVFATLALAFIGSLLLQFNFEFTFATIFAGALGIFSVRDIKNRGQFFVSAGLVFLGYLVVLTADWLVAGTPVERLGWDVLMVAINSFFLIMALPLLWIFERAFGITTDLTLLELSDTNLPLLKELSLRAPGTFNHSLQVANLAEAGADAVGANALLARVGALYHDVGKMVKPEYFVENQRPGENPHDQLKPRMSALIIASHVKEGIEIAKENNLPQVVLDFIPAHHGTTRIEYFYRRAMDQMGEEDPPLLDSEFRYPGPRPKSRETSILMIADSVEAASRSITAPTHKRLESLIDKIIADRREDDQFIDSELTQRDLNTVKETFLSMLLAIHHVRVKYPDQEKEEASEALADLKDGDGGMPAEVDGNASSEDTASAKTPPDSADALRQPEKAEAAPNDSGIANTSSSIEHEGKTL